ncbi:endothelial zinc finger protein induced by tumor necrosis factor alpha [Plutella xylostella]|uniref:endothelial zinc finger protein induced by tumor necrosis factor alpha n=1 Tax=Plutella xylostella TaxID=51655 RepID=UPI002032D8EF|nr:endothelial zinc finger protein induced by tumor necrosis factor alpha [Plutella xylostella]
MQAYYLLLQLQTSGGVCWECRALLLRLSAFTEQARRAQDLLRVYTVYTDHQKTLDLDSLSRLGCTSKNEYDCVIYTEGVIKGEESVKIEELKSDITLLELNPVPFFDSRSQSPLSQCDVTPANPDASQEPETIKYETEDDISLSTLKKKKSKQPVKTKKVAAKKSKKVTRKKTKAKPDTDDDDDEPSNDGQEQKSEQNASSSFKYIVRQMSEEEFQAARTAKANTSHFKKAEFKCESCITAFFDKKRFDAHMETKHAKSLGPHECNICGTRFKKAFSLSRHTSEHYRGYRCRLCDYAHYNQSSVESHYLKEHDTDTTFDCNTCGAKFETKRMLRYHRDTTHKEAPRCELCRRQFKTTTILKHHYLTHAPQPELECEVCHKRYKGARNLAVHARSHRAPRAPPELAFCAECDRQFKSALCYRYHVKYHPRHRSDDVLKFKCEHCDKRFISRTFLNYHVTTIHLRTYPHQCHLCSKSFSRSFKLKEHVQFTHEGKVKVKDKLCPYCGKAFNNKKVLNNHVRVHTGEKPFQCGLCAASFAQQSTLTTHVRGFHMKLKKR